LRIAVVTVSDRASRGSYEDLSGPGIERILSAAWPEAEISREIVADEAADILAALDRSASADWIVTSGGTGPSPRDVTPEATRAWVDRELPGIAEALRAALGLLRGDASAERDLRNAVKALDDARSALTMTAQGVTAFATANVQDYQGLGFRKVWNPLVSS